MQKTAARNNTTHSTNDNATAAKGSTTVRGGSRFLDGLKTGIGEILSALSGHKRKADAEVLTTTSTIPAMPVPETGSHPSLGDTSVIPAPVPIAMGRVLETAAVPADVPIDAIDTLDTSGATNAVADADASEAITASTHSPLSEQQNFGSRPLSPETTPPSLKKPRRGLTTTDSQIPKNKFHAKEALEASIREAYDKLAQHLARYGFSNDYMRELNNKLASDGQITKRKFAAYYTKFDQGLTNIVAANRSIPVSMIQRCVLQIIDIPYPKFAIDQLELIGQYYTALRTTLQLSDEQIFYFVRNSHHKKVQFTAFVSECDFLIEKKFTPQLICLLIDKLISAKVPLFFKYGKILVGPQSVFKDPSLFAAFVIKAKKVTHLERHLALLASDELQLQLKSQQAGFFQMLPPRAALNPSKFRVFLTAKLSVRNVHFDLEPLTRSPHSQNSPAHSPHFPDFFPDGVANDDGASISDNTRTDTDAGADVANMDDVADANVTDVENMGNVEEMPEKNAAAEESFAAAASITSLAAAGSFVTEPPMLVNSDQTLQSSNDMQTILSDTAPHSNADQPQSQVVNTSSLFKEAAKTVSPSVSREKAPINTPAGNPNSLDRPQHRRLYACKY